MIKFSDGRRLCLRLAWLNVVAGLLLLAAFATNGIDRPATGDCTKKVIDFHVFWAAGGFGIQGTPLLAFDQDALRAAYGSCSTKWLPWVHPAPAMLLLAPFAMLPFLPAWGLFNALSLTALAAALHNFTGHRNGMFVATLLAPAMLPALMAGQFSLLWIAGLLGAIAALRADRPILAGLLIGCLTIKPTLGLLIPAALVAIWAFRTIIVAALTSITIHTGAILYYGTDYWSTWRDVSAYHAIGNINQLGNLDKMTSISAALSRLGIDSQTGVALNLGLALVLAVVVFVVWRKYTVHSDIAAGVLFAAIPVATPYLWYYDAAFLAIAAMFLLKARKNTIGPMFCIAVIVAWLGPGLSVWYAATIGDGTLLPPVFFIPPVLLMTLGLCLALTASETPQQET